MDTTESPVQSPCSDAVVSIRCSGDGGCVGARVCLDGDLQPCACVEQQAEGEGASVPVGEVCSDDATCGVAGLCADDPAAAGYCARECDYDGSCGEGQVCGLAANGDADRIDRICSAPIGGGDHTMVCNAASDCAHGVCVAEGAHCSQFCRTGADCPMTQPRCVRAALPVPGASVAETVQICAS